MLMRIDILLMPVRIRIGIKMNILIWIRIQTIPIHNTDLYNMINLKRSSKTWREAAGQLHVSGQLIPSTTPPLSATWRPFTETAMRMREHARNSL